MEYDPIKQSLGSVFNKTPFLRKLFYVLLDILLLRAWHIKKELRKWNKTAPSNAHILDAGAGFGQYVHYMSRLNSSFSIVGIDVKQTQVDDCNTFFTSIGKTKVQYILGDLTQYISNKPADMILCVDVMEHILEDTKVFENFYASLQNKGMVLISTPSDQGGSDVHDEHDESFVGEHVRDGYSISDITQKLQSAGFSKVEAYYSYGTFGKISWKLSMKYPILLINFSKLCFLILPIYYSIVMPFCLILNALDVNTKNTTGTGLIVKAYKE